MSGLGSPVLINNSRSYWLSSISNDVVHSTVTVDTLDANFANISSFFANDATVSTAKFSTFGVANLDVSGMYVSSLAGNSAFLSTLFLASGDGVNPFMRFTTDPSGIQVDGCPIRFDNLVYLTSTINIIQVSTLVDQDIFAQNGYFSTISTGNLSANQTAINQANISSLYVSSIEAYDISGFESRDWSLYPTLNSSIIFQPGFVLSNVGSNIFFAGQNLLQDLSGANIWSQFPAVSTILANNNSITGISTLQFQDTSRLYSLTGNNLFYNGNPVQVGTASNVSQWANFPAVSNVNMNTSSIYNAGGISGSNLTLTGSNITSGNTFTNSLGVGGTSLISLATINSLGQLSCQDIDVSNPAIGLADVNIYGNLAVPGDNALYVQGGVTFTGNGVAVHGTTIGCGLQVGGFDTIRMDILPAAGIFQTTTLPWAATSATSASLTAGGILTLAGGSEIEANTSDFNIINSSQGNKNTTLTVGNILSPPDIAATSSLTIQNTAGGGIQIQAGGQGSITGFSTIIGSNLSSINLDVSTINGIDWQDISGSVYTTTSSFNNLYASSLQLSSLIGVGGFPIKLQSFLQFETFNSIDNVTNININSDFVPALTLQASTINIGANNTFLGQSASSTRHFIRAGQISTLQGIGGFLDVSGGINTTNSINLPYATGVGLNLDGPGQFTNLAYRDIAANSMVALTDFAGTASNNMKALGVGEVWITGGADEYAANRLYNVFPYNNFGIDLIDADGTTLFEWMYGDYYGTGLNPGYVTVMNSLSTFTGFQGDGTYPITTIQDGIRLSTIDVSTINGYQFSGGGGGGTTNLFSTLFTSSFSFSTATSAGSNINYNYPIFLDYDQATNISTAGVAIAVQGHNFGTGAVVNRIEMGARGNGDNYIMSVWPGQNLEDLYIDATELIVRDSDGFSTIINQNPYGLRTNGSIEIGLGGTEITSNSITVSSLIVSSINSYNAVPAFANVIQLSSMRLEQSNSTICWWDQISPNDFVNASGYDISIGQNGTYKIGASRQYNNQSGTDVVEYYFIKNGAAMEYTNSKTQVVNNSELIAYSEIVDTFVNGDIIQLGQYTTSADIYLSTFPGAYCSSPAVIATIYKLDW